MIKKIFIFVILTVFSACENKKNNAENVNVAAEKEAINTMLDAWHKSASEAEYDSYFKSMAKASVFIGTDASENWNKKDFKVFSKPFFDRGEAWDFKSLERNVYIASDGETAWFDELLETWMGVCRGSGVLAKTEDGWKIEHYVLSVTIPNEHIDEVIAIKKDKDSTIMARLRKQQ